mmetsp:Transcript_38609/g.66272  ORF Transcript_38609/g.66272 Transcript_38609/m.66272 type:complete len:203 (-) Transcript_38609:41-649(-)|eukprot:CAMPEP_0206179762 /NCGR_PEP_ID=MMETSP1474-20131121/67491_1 /ASSEMBLY_ACC=CAM_ASM_001110 /TAXON_ID=97495 /ORGANISM="Imantonia sp., Strain RCC918" /LENGTH=202 /DNA_ID=CAMNT_0053593063 /DNA_START=23 /DNA_END=631 /DNA_ORIENTATION=-
MKATLVLALLSPASCFQCGAAVRPTFSHTHAARLVQPPRAVVEEESKVDQLLSSVGKLFNKEEMKGSVKRVNSAAATEDESSLEAAGEQEEEGWTLDKVAALGLAGVLSIAVAETVFWVLSFPISELLYFVSTGEWIDLLSQEGQLKFLAFTAGWGALGGVVAQYRTVLTAAAMTPWMDENVVKPYLQPIIDGWKGDRDDSA